MLIDDILTNVKPRSDIESTYLEHIRRSTIIKIHNVAQYIFESPPTRWDLERDFPNIAPPFENMWMEWSHRCDWGFTHTKPCSQPVNIPMGISLQSFKVDETVEDGSPIFAEIRERFPDCKWVTMGFLHWRGKDGDIDCPPGLGWGVSSHGEMIAREKMFFGRPHPLLPDRPMTDNDEAAATAGKLAWLLSVPFMALSFMHCKNVHLDKSPPHPPALQRARQRRGRTFLVRWHTLTIDPIRKVVADANSGNPSLTPKAFHKVRGHFKQYDQAGLFGKHRGLFWWPEFNRGSLAAGIVHKDYRVLAGHPQNGDANGR